MNLFDFLRLRFKREPFNPEGIPGGSTTGKLPFVQLFGSEKSYGRPAPQDFDKQVAHYRSWAFACAQKNAFSVAKVPLKLYTEKIDGDEKELEEITEHPFLDMMRNVNPFSNRFELWTLTQTFLELTGNAYWWMPKDALRTPNQIWHIPSNWMRIVPSAEKFISGYVMIVPQRNSAPVPLPEDEVVHFKFPSPFDIFYGTGPLFAAAYGMDMNDQMKEWGINYFLNNAQPSGVLQMEDSIDDKQYQRLKDDWNQRHRGSGNAGKIAVLQGGMKYVQTGSNLRDARFEDVSREVRDEILAIFGVPASKLGLVEDVNRANADANDYSYQKETVLPRLMLIEEKINEKVMPMFDESLIAKFDNPVPEDKEFRLREIESHINCGYSTIDEEREKDGLDPYGLPETSTPKATLDAERMEADREAMANAEPKEEPKEKTFSPNIKSWDTFAIMLHPVETMFATSMKRYFKSQHRDVINNLNKYKAMSKDVQIKASLPDSIIFNLNEQNAKLKVISHEFVHSGMVSAAKLAFNETDHTINFSLYDVNLERILERRLNYFTKIVNDNTIKMLKDEIVAGTSKGETLDAISQRISNVMQFSEDFRSSRIATTEIFGSANESMFDAFKTVGFKAKEWVTARDERVRDSHAALDGKVIGLTEAFQTINGSQLYFPGDASTADPGEYINCRCRLAPQREL